MEKRNYKLLVLNKILRLPFVIMLRILTAGWIGLEYAAEGLVLGCNAVFNKRNAVRIRKVWRGYHQLCSDTGDYFVNLMFFKGKLGLVHFNVEDDNADGQIILRVFGDARMVPVNYSIENRWLVSNKGLPSGYVLSEIRTQAIEQGFQIAYITWQGKKMMPYAVAPISLLRRVDDVVLPAEERWTEAQEFPQYEGDPLAKNSAILIRC